MNEFYRKFKHDIIYRNDFKIKKSLGLDLTSVLKLYTLFDSEEFTFDNEMDDIQMIEDFKEWKTI